MLLLLGRCLPFVGVTASALVSVSFVVAAGNRVPGRDEPLSNYARLLWADVRRFWLGPDRRDLALLVASALVVVLVFEGAL